MRFVFTLLFFAMTSITAFAAPLLRLVPTFENCSVYVEDAGIAPGELALQYRKKGSLEWLVAHGLVSTSTNPSPRTSLFLLDENTEYEVRCLKDGEQIAEGSFKTWRSDVPIGRKVVLTSNEPLLIDANGAGTQDGWVCYSAGTDFALDGGNEDEESILVEKASYVIIDGLNIKGGKRHGIQIRNSHHVIIRNCDISGFGRVGERGDDGKYYEKDGKKPINWDAGVYIDLCEQVVVENCYIHDPRGTANSWAFGHPAGPNAVFVRAGEKGGIVLRYNDFIGSMEHRWNDVVEGYGNGKSHGGFRCDSDIYGNFLAYPNDDCIELDGGQQNIRFYGNKLEGGLCGISTAANLVGPSYIFNNLVTNLGDGRGSASAAVKNGGGSSSSKGMTYFYNNTFFSFGRGITGVGFGSDKNKQMFLGRSRNNILDLNCSGISDQHVPPECDYDYDLFATPEGGRGGYDIKRPMEEHAIFGDPMFVDALAGDFRLKPGSPALNSGIAVPGFPASSQCMGALTSGRKHEFLPWRPGTASLDKYLLRFKAIAGQDDACEDTVTVNTGKMAGAQGFRILKNSAFPWLKVSPESGVLQPDSKMQLKVSVDESKAVPGTNPGAFVVKLDSGNSIPVAVYAVLAETAFKKLYSAVECEGADKFKRETVDRRDCLNFSGKPNEGITISPDIPVAGRYYLYYNVKCPQPYPLHDSLFVSINGSGLELCGVTPSGNWHWDCKPGKTPYIILEEGVNNILVAQREELYLSAVMISSTPLFPGEKIDLKDTKEDAKDER